MLNDAVDVSAPLLDIPCYPSGQHQVCICLDVDLEIQQISQLGIVEDEQTFDDDHRGSMKTSNLVGPIVNGKVVAGDLD